MPGFLSKRNDAYTGIALGIGIIAFVWIPDMPPMGGLVLFLVGSLVSVGSASVSYFQSGRPVNLRQLTSDELREHTTELALQLRHLESAHKVEQRRALFLPRRRDITEEERKRQWDAEIVASRDSHLEHEARYKTTLHGPAVAAMNELHHRLGITKLPSGIDQAVLGFGVLSGPTPLEEAANYLDDLARRLT